MTGAHSDFKFAICDLPAAPTEPVYRTVASLPLQVTTREARTVFMVPGPVIRIMRHEPMMWRGTWLKVID